MSVKFKRILYGGDYNPNQWPKDVWLEDMRILKNAHINSATVNVFSWAKIQPSEERYSFEELDEIIAMLSKEQYDIVLATSTAALPAWLYKRYPEVARTDYEGRRHKFGRRHNACPNSPVYRHYARALAEELAKRYGSNKNIVCWHINNEYGGECYCENCEKSFRVWLREKYQSIETLNHAWNLEFWGHTVYEWDEIVLPNALSEGLPDDKTAFAGISIDYRRFNSDSLLSNFVMERDAVRLHDPVTPITTNMMGTYKGLDYFKWAKELDIVSWDSYPAYDSPWSYTAMCHDLMRGLKRQSFMLMEQTPSQQNWQPYNSLKRPGQMRAQSYQTIAHGADTIQFFQLRRSVGGCEKFHGAVISHAGTENTRVFHEVEQLGRELADLNTVILGAETFANVGMVFDWDNYWALEYTSGPTVDLDYVNQIHKYYQYFYKQNITVDMIPYDANFGKYKLLVAPVLYMVKPGMKEALEAYVKNGGVLVTTYMSGIVDQSDNVHLGGYPGPLRELTGVWVEEIDALAPELNNEVVFEDGTRSQCGLVYDLMHLEAAQGVAVYGRDFYAGRPAVTKNKYGDGCVYYIGTDIVSDGLFKILDMSAADAMVVPIVDEKTTLEITCRHAEDRDIYFILNFHDEAAAIPSRFAGKINLLTNKVVTDNETLAKYDVMIVEFMR